MYVVPVVVVSVKMQRSQIKQAKGKAGRERRRTSQVRRHSTRLRYAYPATRPPIIFHLERHVYLLMADPYHSIYIERVKR